MSEGLTQVTTVRPARLESILNGLRVLGDTALGGGRFAVGLQGPRAWPPPLVLANTLGQTGGGAVADGVLDATQ